MYDKRKKYVCILDVETANIMDDPLVYDLGYIIADLHGNIMIERSYAISDIYIHEAELMQTAYYAEKLPSYKEEINKGTRLIASLYKARKQLLEDMQLFRVKEIYAYNAHFDRRALNTTIRWTTKSRFRYFFPYKYKFYCIWNMACTTTLQQKTFQKLALIHQWITPSGRYFSSSAEVAYKYIIRNPEFVEEHKGIDDVRIEYQIFLHALRQKKKMNKNIKRNCFQLLKVPK